MGAGLHTPMGRKQGEFKGGTPLALGHPTGASSIPVGTRLSPGKSSVLYLPAWLAGKTGCGALCAPFAPAGKQSDCLHMGMGKQSGWFQGTAAGICLPSLVLRHDLWSKCPEVAAPHCFAYPILLFLLLSPLGVWIFQQVRLLYNSFQPLLFVLGQLSIVQLEPLAEKG